MEKQKVTKNIFMIGFMGSGKSSVSLQLADMTGLPKAEMDQILVDREQMSIADIFAEKGEPYFRAQGNRAAEGIRQHRTSDRIMRRRCRYERRKRRGNAPYRNR